MHFDERPFIAIWEVTQACDLVCQHCRASAQPCSHPDELTTQEGHRLLDAFAFAKVPLVVLTGGDPAKRRDLTNLVRYGSDLGLTMGLTPSATPLVTRELVEELAGAGLKRLAISIDGATPVVHDAFRGASGSYQRSLEILSWARETGLTTQVNTTVYANTIDELGRIAKLVESLEATLWSVFYIVPTGRAHQDLMPSADDVERSLEELVRIAETAPFAIKTTAAPHYRRIALQHKKDSGHDVVIGARGRQAMWVNDARGLLFVSHTGNIFPSGFLPTICGNIRHHDPIRVYRYHPVFRALRDADSLEGKCGSCEYRQVCGGSRARAYALTGDMLASDPLCAYVPPGYTGDKNVWRGTPSATPSTGPLRLNVVS